MVCISTASLDMGATHYLKKKNEIAATSRLAAGKKIKCKTFVIDLSTADSGWRNTSRDRIWHLSVAMTMCCIVAELKTPATGFDTLEWP